MGRWQRSVLAAAITVAVNAAVFGFGSAVGWFDGVVASATGEPIGVLTVGVASIVGVLGLGCLRVAVARWRGPVRGRRVFVVAALAILVVSFGSPIGGLDDSTTGATVTLMLTHVVTVVGGLATADILTKPTWGWGWERYRVRELPDHPVALVTGITGGIGGATALALAERGFTVVGVGRRADAADALAARAERLAGTIDVYLADLATMAEAAGLGRTIARQYGESIDVVIHAIGTLEPTASPTSDGIDANIAASWLSRVQVQRQIDLRPGARLVNVAAAESGALPDRLRVELAGPDDLGRGLAAHGQAQLANDLWTASLQRRGLTAFGYGPGSVDTGIRRRIPRPLRAIMRPLFWWSSRRPDDAAADIVRLALDRDLPASGGFASRNGLFEHHPHIHDARRHDDVDRLADTLLGGAAPAP